MNIPQNFIELCNFLHNKYMFKNVLVVRSCTTGEFLDELVLDNTNITRITYITDKQRSIIDIREKINILRKTHKVIKYGALQEQLNTINMKYDLICLDPFHEYEHSYNDLFLLKSLLTENGVLICHDCYPSNKIYTTPYYKIHEWSGITYAVFVELAYNNPDLYFAVINVDYGLGIISKKQIEFVKKGFNCELQKEFVTLLKNNNTNIYEFFIDNATELINIIM